MGGSCLQNKLCIKLNDVTAIGFIDMTITTKEIAVGWIGVGVENLLAGRDGFGSTHFENMRFVE